MSVAIISDNSNNCPISHHLRDIRNRNVHEIDLTFRKDQGYLSMPIEIPYMTFYNSNSNVCPIFYHIGLPDIRNRNVHCFDIHLWNQPVSIINMEMTSTLL